MAIKITAGHSGSLNMRAAYTLNGVDDYGAESIVELMRSGEAIDPQTRTAIADALERRSGIRLELHRGNEAPLLDKLETKARYQEIADQFEARMRQSGAIEKNVKMDLAAEFSVNVRTVATALSERRKAIYRVQKGTGG